MLGLACGGSSVGGGHTGGDSIMVEDDDSRSPPRIAVAIGRSSMIGSARREADRGALDVCGLGCLSRLLSPHLPLALFGRP